MASKDKRALQAAANTGLLSVLLVIIKEPYSELTII